MFKVDPIFKERFGIETPINYFSDVKVEQKIQKRFERAWKRFYGKASSLLSKTRQKQFDAYFRQMEKEGGDERYCRRVSIRFINKKVGYGVFAKEDIPPYSTLHHYAGVLTVDDHIDSDADSTFGFSDLKKYSIDAMNGGNWTRFMNHADERHPTNNVVPWEYYHKEGPRIVFTSGCCGIKKGDQLLYSYGEDYWKAKGKFVNF